MRQLTREEDSAILNRAVSSLNPVIDSEQDYLVFSKGFTAALDYVDSKRCVWTVYYNEGNTYTPGCTEHLHFERFEYCPHCGCRIKVKENKP